MFGKSEWFQPKTVGWGLHPVTWQGWMYALSWMGVIAAPFVALITRQQAPESLIWLTASLAALLWDVRAIRRELQTGKSPRKVLYIDQEGCCQQIAARPCTPQPGK
jgi:hypothetical protein